MFIDDLAAECKEWSLPTEAVIRMSYDGFLAPLRKEALRECLHVWENCIAGISGMHRSTVCRTRVHEPGKKAELEGCIFPGFVLSSVHSLWHLGEGVCCRRSYPEPLRIFLGAAVPGGEDVFPAEEELRTYGFKYKSSCEGVRYYVRHEQLR